MTPELLQGMDKLNQLTEKGQCNGQWNNNGLYCHCLLPIVRGN